MNTPLIHLIYASTTTATPSAAELANILQASRRNNEPVGVTGILLYTEGSFFQVLEGDPREVDRVFDRIARDSRHRNVVTIIRERIHRRAFGEWSMGFAELNRDDLRSMPGANDFFGDAVCFDLLDAGRAKKLLTAFRRRRWRLGEALTPSER